MSSLMPKMIQCLLIIALISSFIRPISSETPYTNCTSTANFTSQSPFYDNLQDLLTALVNDASNLHFSEILVGQGHDRVYGNFLCYNTTGNVGCKRCVEEAAEDIKRRCTMNMEAIVWEEDCQLRYSNQKFFGVMDYTTYTPPLYNELKYSEPEAFRVVVKNLLNNLSSVPEFTPSNNYYALDDDKVGSSDTVYALVQCTRDISPADCSKCLQSAISDIQGCCYAYRGARVLSRSCYLRYELYPLRQPTPPRVPTLNKGEPSNFSPAVIMTIAALVVLVLLLSSWV